MSTADGQPRTSAQKHAMFLRSVLALDSSDPNLPPVVPPADAESERDPEPQVPAAVETRTKRATPRLHPRRPR